MTENMPSIVLSDSLIDQGDTKTRLVSTPLHKLTCNFKITVEELCTFNEEKERSLRHKSVHLTAKFIKNHLQKNQKILTEEEFENLKKSLLARKKDVCAHIRSLVVQTMGYFVLKKQISYLDSLFESLNDSSHYTVLAGLKSIKEILVINKHTEFKSKLINNIHLLLKIAQNEKNKATKEEASNLIFKIYELNFINLDLIKGVIHLAPKEIFKRIIDEIIGYENKEQGYNFIFKDYDLMIKLYQINNEVFSRINYTEKDLNCFIELILERENDFLGLSVLEKVILKNTPLNYFIRLINKNEENLEMVLNILIKMEENEEKINLEEKENLLNLLVEINKKKDILNYIIKYLEKSNQNLFGNFINKLVNKENVNTIIKHFDINFDGDIVYQCYKFLWLVIKEEEIIFKVYDTPLQNYSDLLQFIVYLIERIKKMDVNFKLITKEIKNEFIKLEGNLNEKMTDFLNYLINYLNKHLKKLTSKEVMYYCKLIEEKVILPDLNLLFFVPLRELTLKPQQIIDFLFLFLNKNTNESLLEEVKFIKGSVDVFNNVKGLIGTDKESLIKYFIKFISSTEAIYLESKVVNEEVKGLLKEKIFKSAKTKEIPDENNVSTTFI